jgi:hypothetical protein
MHDGPAPAHDRDLLEFGVTITHVVSHLLSSARKADPVAYQRLLHAVGKGAELRLTTRWTRDQIGDTILSVDIEGTAVEVGRLLVWPVR